MSILDDPTIAIAEQTVPLWNDALKIRVKIAGAGAPVLYLHSAAGLSWDPFLSYLAQRYTVFAPEFPGTSTGDPYAIHRVDHLSDVVLIYEQLARHLDLHRPIIVGHSFGGMLAAELVAAFPNLAAKLVLLDPIGLWREDLPIANWLVAPARELPSLLFHDPDCTAAQTMFAVPKDPDTAASEIAERVWATGVTGKFVWPVPDRGLRHRLHRISSPVFIVWGREDRLIPVDYLDEWRTELDVCQSAVIDNCGHIPQLEKLAETMTALDNFLVAG